ncbi:hypothetical protein VPH35_111393 [Triticum aestivum]
MLDAGSHRSPLEPNEQPQSGHFLSFFGPARCLLLWLARSMAMIKRCLCRSEEDFKGLLRTTNIHLFSYKEIRRATNNFHRSNKLGRGGFGTVYKGTFGDGTAFAAKVLSCESEQGIKEFLTEIESIGEAKHANLVSLLGCCVQKQNRILVYEFAENNSLDHALKALGSASGAAILPWSVRSDICMGTAKGLSYLHEEHEPNMVHRDIKASNVLLGRNYTTTAPKSGTSAWRSCSRTTSPMSPRAWSGRPDTWRLNTWCTGS